jgi:uncharacterized delta-60 repeat protein
MERYFAPGYSSTVFSQPWFWNLSQAQATPLVQPLQPASASLLFIEQDVTDAASIIAASQPGTEIYFLNEGQNAVAQITAALLGRSNIAALSIVSHGQAGGLQFKDWSLNLDNLGQYQSQLQSWRSALTDNADILLYGCNVGQGDLGTAFVQQLSLFTAADVAASTNLTGSAALGGDWTLEVQTGAIASHSLLSATIASQYTGILAPTDFDTTWGTTGKISTDLSGTQPDFLTKLLVQSDKKVLAIGGWKDVATQFAVVRYNENGSLDATFGTNGIRLVPLFSNGPSQDDTIASATLQSDGKIVLVGSTYPNPGSIVQIGVVRLNADGSLDTSFDGDGYVQIDASQLELTSAQSSSASSVTVQSDGKLVIGANISNRSDNNSHAAVIRLNSNGSLDNGFGGNGIAAFQLEAAGFTTTTNALLQSDGNIFVVGTASRDINTNYRTDILAFRLLGSNGSLDATFNGGSLLTLAPSTRERNTIKNFDSAGNATLQTDGKIVIAGTASDDAFTYQDVFVLRLNADGIYDSTFDGNGVVLTDINGGDDAAIDLAIQKNGKIVAVGYADKFASVDNDSLILRYAADGSLDTTWNSTGKLTIDSGASGGEEASSIAVQQDDKLLIAASDGAATFNARNFYALRLMGDPTGPTVNLTTSTPTITEGGTAGTFTISRGTDTTGALTVDLTISGTVIGSDYTFSGGTVSGNTVSVVIPDGQSSVTLNMTALAEAIAAAEAIDTLTLTLATSANYGIGTSSSANIAIAQNGFVVTNINDGGEGSLRQAVLNANVIAGADTITFAGSTFTDATPDTITLTTGELAIAESVTITGTGANLLTISGNNASRIFSINSFPLPTNQIVNLSGMTLSNGFSSLNDGGAILNFGFLTIRDSILKQNNTNRNGGAIFQDIGGALTLISTSFENNSSTFTGGAITLLAGTINILNSSFINNSAASGGAIWIGSSSAPSVNMMNSTLSGNTARDSGGAIQIFGNTNTFTNLTITNNTADSNNDGTGDGGGISIRSGGALLLQNSLVAGNFDTPNGTGTGTKNPDLSGTLSGSFNLIGRGEGSTGLSNGVNDNQVGTIATPIDPKLGALANNGGTTQTHALLNDSPAINAGNNASLPVDTYDLDGDSNTTEALPVDQRGTGFARQIGARVDIGAVESSAINIAPQIALPGATVTYTENAAAILLDSTATVQDRDSSDFNTGTLTVSFTANGTASDRLTIRNEGPGTTQINLDGRKIRYGSTEIGSYTGGIGNESLVISFNANATPEIAQTLLRNIIYSNLSDNPNTNARTVSFVLTDGTGGTSTAVTKTINLTSSNDSTLIAQRTVLADGTTNPTTKGWQYQSLPGAATVSTANDFTTVNTSLNPAAVYAGFSRNDQTLDAAAGFVLSFQANVLIETLTGNADKNADGKTDRAVLSLTLVTSDNTKAIELGFTKTGTGIRIFAQEDGTNQSNPALETDSAPTDITRQLFTQAEGVDTTNPTQGYDLYVKGDLYTLFRDGAAILSGKLRNYTGFAGSIDPYQTPNLISFSDNTASASGSFSLGKISLLNGNIAAQTIDEDNATTALEFGVFDVEGNSVNLTNTSSNITLVPNANIVTAGTGVDRTVTVTPAANVNGNSIITLTANDGITDSNTNFSLTVNPENDAAIIAGTLTGIATEDVTTATTGVLTINDPDAGQANFVAQTNAATTYGTFNLDAAGTWTYSLDSTKPAVQALKTGTTLTDTITVKSADNTDKSITITINGADDAAVIAGTLTGTATEDVSTAVTGTLSITDPDAGQANFIEQSNVATTYGTFSLDTNGTWSYSLDNTNPTVQALKVGTTLTDTITIQSADNTSKSITITINGANDTPIFTPPAATLVAGTEDTTYTINTSDLLTGYTDIDGDSLSIANLTATNGTLSNNNATFTPIANFNGTVTLTYDVVDGNSGNLTGQTRTLTIAPVNDAPTALTLTNPINSLDENRDTITRIAIATIELTDDGTGNNVFTLGGDDRDYFEIDGTTVYLKANTPLNYEATAQYYFSVIATDNTLPPSASLTELFTVTITDQNDPMTGFVDVVGDSQLGNQLIFVNALDDEDGIDQQSLQWQQSIDGINWNNIVNASSDTFTITSNQIGQQIRLQVLTTDNKGNTTTSSSDPTATVIGIQTQGNLTTIAGISTQTVNNWASDLTQSGYPAGLNYVITTDRPDLFEVLPTLLPTGELKYTPKPYVNLNAIANLKIEVKNADGAIDNNLTQTVTLTFKYKPEALVRNSVSNQLVLLYVDQLTQLQAQRRLTYGSSFGAQAGQAVTIPQAWTIADTADFNRDGVADILLHNQSNDEVQLVMVGNEGQVMSMRSLTGQDGRLLKTGNLNWKVIGFADLDGDTILDLVWHNQQSDEVGFWFMNSDGQSVKSYDYLRDGNGNLLKTQNTLWQIVDMADFDGDGDADLLFRLKELNQTAIVRLDGKIFVDTQYITANTNANLEIRGVGDANADRTADIYWQTPDNQQVLVQLINFTTTWLTDNFKAISSTAPLQGVGDLDLNNTADVLFKEPSVNGLAITIVNANALTPAGNLQNSGTAFSFTDANWQIEQMDEFGDVVATTPI